MKQLIALTAEQAVEIDRLLVSDYGLQSQQLIENAGRLVSRFCRIFLGTSSKIRTYAVLIGPGKIAGCGLAAARTLHNWGADVHVILAASRAAMIGSTVSQLEIIKLLGIKIEDEHHARMERLGRFDLIIDALLGYGDVSEPSDEIANLINKTNKAKRPVVSLDVPTGIDTTSGEVFRPCINATATVALGTLKNGIFEKEALMRSGALWLADIGIPQETFKKLGLNGDNPFIFDDLVLVRGAEEQALESA